MQIYRDGPLTIRPYRDFYIIEFAVNTTLRNLHWEHVDKRLNFYAPHFHKSIPVGREPSRIEYEDDGEFREIYYVGLSYPITRVCFIVEGESIASAIKAGTPMPIEVKN